MLFPREMSEIELIVPSKDMLAVTKVLSGYGVFHQTDSNYSGTASGPGVNWQEQAGAYAALERRVQLLMQALSIAEDQPVSSDPGSIVELDQLRPAVEKVEAQVKGLTDE